MRQLKAAAGGSPIGTVASSWNSVRSGPDGGRGSASHGRKSMPASAAAVTAAAAASSGGNGDVQRGVVPASEAIHLRVTALRAQVGPS